LSALPDGWPYWIADGRQEQEVNRFRRQSVVSITAFFAFAIGR
jgi:hypothetical protein